MNDLLIIVLLLAVVVIAAYFYLKRRQQQTHLAEAGGAVEHRHERDVTDPAAHDHDADVPQARVDR